MGTDQEGRKARHETPSGVGLRRHSEAPPRTAPRRKARQESAQGKIAGRCPARPPAKKEDRRGPVRARLERASAGLVCRGIAARRSAATREGVAQEREPCVAACSCCSSQRAVRWRRVLCSTACLRSAFLPAKRPK